MSLLSNLNPLNWIPNIAVGVLDSAGDKLLQGYKAKLENATGQDKMAVDLAIKKIEADQAITAKANDNRASLAIALMNHKAFWVAWLLFVIPVGAYNAAIFIVSTLGIDPTVFAIKRVPPLQEQIMLDMIKSIFGLQVTAGAIGTVGDVVRIVAERFRKV